MKFKKNFMKLNTKKYNSKEELYFKIKQLIKDFDSFKRKNKKIFKK